MYTDRFTSYAKLCSVGDPQVNRSVSGVVVTQQSSSSRRRLQRTLAVLAAIPMASAIGEIVRGPQGVPGGSPDVLPTVDSSLRCANVFKLAGGPVMLSQLVRVE